MIQIVIRIVHEGAKAAAPHVVRHARHVAPLLLPKLATRAAPAGAVGGAIRLGQLKAKAAHSAASAPSVHVKPHPVSPGTAVKVEHFGEGLAADAALGELAGLGIKAAAKKIGGAGHKGAASPATGPAAS